VYGPPGRSFLHEEKEPGHSFLHEEKEPEHSFHHEEKGGRGVVSSMRRRGAGA
jgi:hypothetical protein